MNCVECNTALRGRKQQVNRVHEEKVKYIQQLGGSCVSCGLKYDGTNGCVFQFHHRDPSTKIDRVQPGWKSTQFNRSEIKKCDLLCANCHFIEHAEEY